MADWWNPFDGDIIPGVNVGNAIKQVTTGQDQDIFGGVTNSNRPGQMQINSLPDWGVRGVQSGGGGGGGGSTPTGGGGGGQVLGSGTGAPGGGAALPALNQAAVDNTQIALDQLPALLRAALEAEATRRGNTVRGFDDQETGQRKTYDESTVTNQQNYDANYMDSIRAGIKGLGNLFGLLRGTGAAGGTAEDLVRDTVGGVTSNDIRTGADTQKGNQTSLDSALSGFLTELKGKRQMADDTFENNNRAINRDNASQMQDLYSKMAGYYGEGGRTAEAQNFMAKAGALTPSIAANSSARQSAYDTTPVAVQAPQLTAFAAPSQPNSSVTPDSGQVGSGIFTMNRKKTEPNPVALPAGV
jgi:hypothetical protein